MVAVETIVLIIVLVIAVIAIGVVLWWRFRSKRDEDQTACPPQPFSLFDVRIHDLEVRLERVKVTLQCLHL